jgi:hypothetical protein
MAIVGTKTKFNPSDARVATQQQKVGTASFSIDDPNDVYVVGSDDEYTLDMAVRSWRHRRFSEWPQP